MADLDDEIRRLDDPKAIGNMVLAVGALGAGIGPAANAGNEAAARAALVAAQRISMRESRGR